MQIILERTAERKNNALAEWLRPFDVPAAVPAPNGFLFMLVAWIISYFLNKRGFTISFVL